jgi:ribulose-phosphate 3-epimerase
MCVRSWEIREHIAAFEEAGVSAIHFDVMDGHFVDNIMLGTSFYRDITELTALPVDLHLMCHRPERYLNFFKPRENDWVSFHANAFCDHPYRLLQQIRELGARAGIVLDPGTPVACLEEMVGVLDFILVMAVNPGFSGQRIVPDHFEKLARVYALAQKAGHPVDVCADGNTTVENGARMVKAGANCLIVGTTSGLLGKGAENFRRHYQGYLKSVAPEGFSAL